MQAQVIFKNMAAAAKAGAFRAGDVQVRRTRQG
jgi:hypothetical protein